MAVVDSIERTRMEVFMARFEEALEAESHSLFNDLAAPEAKAALDLIISRATTSVDIFCDDLSLEAYEPARLADAARRLCRVRVVVYDPVVASHSALTGLKDELRSGKVQVRRTSPVIILDDGHRVSVKPFTVCDGRHVRAEGYAGDGLATVILNANRGAAIEVGKASVDFFKLLWKGGVECSTTDPRR